MAKLTGKVLSVYPTQQLMSKNGNPFQRRDMVIAMQSFDRDTGEPTIDENNTPVLSLMGDRCSQLDNIQPGQIVTVDFYVTGRRYRDEKNQERIATGINVIAVRPAGYSITAPAESHMEQHPHGAAADDIPYFP